MAEGEEGEVGVLLVKKAVGSILVVCWQRWLIAFAVVSMRSIPCPLVEFDEELAVASSCSSWAGLVDTEYKLHSFDGPQMCIMASLAVSLLLNRTLADQCTPSLAP